MDRGEYQQRKKQLKWRYRFGWLIGIVFGIILSWTVVGLFIGWWGYKMADRASDERKELEREYEDYQQQQAVA